MDNKTSNRMGEPVQSPERSITIIPKILPHERVFSIQIGSELFKLSGASLSSDAPSYFSRYFESQIRQAQEKGENGCSTIRTLYIDRDPALFRDIALHLQGYHISPRDGTHYVRLFADAQFYCLPKLISQLYEESIFISIGHKEFQIPRELFTQPLNTPNFFSLGFAVYFSSDPQKVFLGLSREGLIRPPSILPPSVPNRSSDNFQELMHMLMGYPIHIRNEEHRASLLRDCRFFNFKGIEQRLKPHHISFNNVRNRTEITMKIEDVMKSGISVKAESEHGPTCLGWINYARPFTDDKGCELVLEIGEELTKLLIGHSSLLSLSTDDNEVSNEQQNAAALGACQIRAEFLRDAGARLRKFFEVVASKLEAAGIPGSLDLPAAAISTASFSLPSLSSPPLDTPNTMQLPAMGSTATAAKVSPPDTVFPVRAVIEPATSIMLDGKAISALSHPSLVGLVPGDREATVATTGVAGEGAFVLSPDSGLGYENRGLTSALSGVSSTAAQPIAPPISSTMTPNTPVPHQAQQQLDVAMMMTMHRQALASDNAVGASGMAAPNVPLLQQPWQALMQGMQVPPHQQAQHLASSSAAARKRRHPDNWPASMTAAENGPRAKRGRVVEVLSADPSEASSVAWVIRTGQWRLRLQQASLSQKVECVLVAVKLDAYSTEAARNNARQFSQCNVVVCSVQTSRSSIIFI